jgi:ribosomal protein S17E
MTGEKLPIPRINVISANSILTTEPLHTLENNTNGYLTKHIVEEEESCELCARSTIQCQIDTLIKSIQELKEQLDELARVQTKKQREKLDWLKNKKFLK